MAINSGEKWDVYYRYDEQVEKLHQRLLNGESTEKVFEDCWDELMMEKLEERIRQLPTIKPERTEYLAEISGKGLFTVIDKRSGYCAIVSPVSVSRRGALRVECAEGIHRAVNEVRKTYMENQERGTEIIRKIFEIAVEQGIFSSNHLPDLLKMYGIK